MNFKDFLKDNIVIADGGMGTLLQERGLKPGELPELWNITHPEVIQDIHKAYFDAGSNFVQTNTFGANLLKFEKAELEKIISSAVENAKIARDKSMSEKEKFIALDIGPLGKLLKPLGDMEFEKAVSVFAETVKIGAKCGVDLVVIETMNDSYETKAALLAVKENSSLPVIVSNAYSENSKLMTGATPEAMAAMLEGMGADAIGANCSLGPKMLKEVVEKLLKNCSVPIFLKPNAGLPKEVDGKTVFDVLPDEFGGCMKEYIKMGVRVAGGCCGTTPEYIKALADKTKDLKPQKIEDKNLTVVSSYSHAVKFGDEPILIGERINPTGKKRFKEALKENDMDYILSEGIAQQEKGVHILDVNVGLPEIDEASMLEDAVKNLQAVLDLPLQIDTADAYAMEKALRAYNGKAMINSVSGKKESMEKIFPLVKKYGGVVVALTLDEGGIPESFEGRVKIAEKILKEAEAWGISRKDIVFDTLAMTVSAEPLAAVNTLKALSVIKNELSCHTSLGVSNVSFGLPNRDGINSTFFALALASGLSAAIMNPHSAEMMKTYYSYKALCGMDENLSEYITKSEEFKTVTVSGEAQVKTEEQIDSLKTAIEKGLKEKSHKISKELLNKKAPLEIVSEDIIPALNSVGEGFEKKTVYLPQLLMSAEAAKAAFENIKSFLSAEDKKEEKKGTIVLATVEGDIHDIGKNIVKLLLENYGFEVLDLGKDVKPETILEAAEKNKAPLVGLSALMTTTVPAMEKTIKLLNEKLPNCKTVVGGAVLTKDYAEKIGADRYAKDAMEAVRYAEEIFR